MAGSKTYVYCNVLPSGYKSPYLYITDFEVKPGDIVIIPLRDSEKAGLVIDVNTYSDDNAPLSAIGSLAPSAIPGRNFPSFHTHSRME